MGALLLGMGNGLVCIAEQSVSSGLAAVAVASSPLWMGVFAAMRGERPGRMEWVGLAFGFVEELGAGAVVERPADLRLHSTDARNSNLHKLADQEVVLAFAWANEQ